MSSALQASLLISLIATDCLIFFTATAETGIGAAVMVGLSETSAVRDQRSTELYRYHQPYGDSSFICPSPLVYYSNATKAPTYHTILAANDYCAVPCPTIEYSPREWDTINKVVSILVIISFCSCLLVFLSHVTEFYKYYIRLMFIGGFLVNSLVIGLFVLLNQHDNIVCDGDVFYVETGPLCVFQAAATIWSFIWTNTWSAILAYDTLLHVSLLSKPGSEFFARVKYTVIAVAISTTVVAVPLFTGNLGFDPDANVPICLFMVSRSPEIFWFSFVVPFYLLLLSSLVLTVLVAWRVHKVFILSRHYKTALSTRKHADSAIYTPMHTSERGDSDNADEGGAFGHQSESHSCNGVDDRHGIAHPSRNSSHRQHSQLSSSLNGLREHDDPLNVRSEHFDGRKHAHPPLHPTTHVNSHMQLVHEGSEADSSLARDSESGLNAADIISHMAGNSFDLNNSFCFSPSNENTDADASAHDSFPVAEGDGDQRNGKDDMWTLKTPLLPSKELENENEAGASIEQRHEDDAAFTEEGYTPVDRYSDFQGVPHTPTSNRHQQQASFWQTLWQSLTMTHSLNHGAAGTTPKYSSGTTSGYNSAPSSNRNSLRGNRMMSGANSEESSDYLADSQVLKVGRHQIRSHSSAYNSRINKNRNSRSGQMGHTWQSSSGSQSSDKIDGHMGVIGWCCCCLCCSGMGRDDIRCGQEEDTQRLTSNKLLHHTSTASAAASAHGARPNRLVSTTTNSNKQLEAAYLLSAIWNYNGRSILFVIVFCLTTLLVFPLDFDLFFIKFDEFRASSSTFVDCLVNASTYCVDQSVAGVQLCADERCGTRPSHRPNLAQVPNSLLASTEISSLFFYFVLDVGPSLLCSCVRNSAFDYLWLLRTDLHEIFICHTGLLPKSS
jgi:hypothetical protein